MSKKTILSLVLMLTISFVANAIVFEKPASNVFFEKNSGSFSVTWQGEFINVTVDDLMDYTECLYIYNNYNYYKLLKEFSNDINETTMSLHIPAKELYEKN